MLPNKSLPEILVMGALPFPFGTAGSNYLRGHACAIRSAGLSVGVLADQPSGRLEDITECGGFSYRGIDYWAIRRKHRSKLIHRMSSTLLGMHDDRLSWLQAQQPLDGVKAIMFYPGMSRTVPFLLRLRGLCRLNGISLFVFCVEWHEPGRFGVGRLSVSTVDAEVQRRFINPRLDGVVCISEYLQAYYLAHGSRTVLIPPLLDMQDGLWTTRSESSRSLNDGTVRILFSGSFGRDKQDLILRAVSKVRSEGMNIIIEYVGATKEDIAALPGVGQLLIKELGPGIHFHGQVPLAGAMRLASEASYGIVLRENSRWSQAGFPSKVPEFLALGVPVIANLNSDLSKYLVDGENALIVKHLNVECVAAVLRRCYSIPREGKEVMRLKTMRSATAFDARNYGSIYRRFLLPEDVVSRKDSKASIPSW
jgi:glycosyltransferase involved in cell wall biosynthesis